MKKHLSEAISLILFALLSSCDEDLHDKSISIVSITKTIDKANPSHEMCDSFVLSRDNVATYFAIAEEVDEYTFNQQAIIFPCKYKGSINISGEEFNWQISAGGAGYLYRNKEVNKRYLCQKNCCEFLPNLC